MASRREREKARKKKGRRSGLVGFALVFLLFNGSSGFENVATLIFGGIIGFAVYKLISAMASGLDLTTHNRQDKPEVEDAVPLSGDKDADTFIEQAREMLRKIRKVNKAIPDLQLTEQLDRLERLCTMIFRTVSEEPAKEPQIRKFMSYYLPTTLKMLNNYRVMQDRGVSAGDLAQVRDTLTRSLEMIINACQKELDNLHKENILDVTTDMDVLEQMLMRDGLMDGDGTENAPMLNTKGATTATAQQLQFGAPVLEVQENDDEEKDSYDFRRYFNQKK